MEIISLFNEIGSKIGYASALLVFYLYIRIKDLEKRMKEGDERFERVEKELKENNGLLRELVGMFKMSMRAKGHTPEDMPL